MKILGKKSKIETTKVYGLIKSRYWRTEDPSKLYNALIRS